MVNCWFRSGWCTIFQGFLIAHGDTYVKWWYGAGPKNHPNKGMVSFEKMTKLTCQCQFFAILSLKELLFGPNLPEFLRKNHEEFARQAFEDLAQSGMSGPEAEAQVGQTSRHCAP